MGERRGKGESGEETKAYKTRVEGVLEEGLLFPEEIEMLNPLVFQRSLWSCLTAGGAHGIIMSTPTVTVWYCDCVVPGLGAPSRDRGCGL